MRTVPQTLLLLCSLLCGCADESEPLLVRGSAEISVGDARTGLSFPTDTHLQDERVAPADGRIAGHCTLSRSAGDATRSVDIALVRSGPLADADVVGLRSLSLRAPAASREAVLHVEADLGGSVYRTADAGCTASVVTSADNHAPNVALQAVCNLTSTGGSAATFTAELDFRGCDVL